MKQFIKYSLILSFGALLLGGCDTNFEGINTSPNRSDASPTPYIFTYATRQFAYNYYNVWYTGRQSGVACQQWCQINYTSEDRYQFRDNVMNEFFRNSYIWMLNFEKIKELNTDPATKGNMSAYGDNKMQIATCDIMETWIFQLLTDSFGDIPYSQAFDPVKYPKPKYDKQSDIYKGMVAKLKQAVADLKTCSNGWTSGDIIYGGDIDKWIKFANSLRLRIALRASKVDRTYLTEAKSAITDGVFKSNDDNAIFNFIGTGEPNEAPIYFGFFTDNRNDFTLTKQFVNLLKGMDDNDKGFVNPFNGIIDPRLAIYRGPTMDNNTIGVPYGMDDTETAAFVSANGNVINLKPDGKKPALSPVNLQPEFGSVLLDYPTVCFMISEVEDNDAVWFLEGVKASLDKWGVSTTDKNAYVAAVTAKWNVATVDKKKEMLITSKYIHLYTQAYEAWAEYRRTGYPKSLVKPGEKTYGDITFEPIPGFESGNDIVARFSYAISEYTLNKENVKAAAASMGSDALSVRVWWAGGGKQ
ncbi:SusD/RagB family nutrient-binding outer membrane lipoprotein [uncultured Acetobacteroides sp.]|uniref:SusD/RagB family nutrient-binding outer membrane lipoprotein n=1 Tax=uncultured Acetobacteroides sp. TaxID=1760811 RepID=UPI0029F48DF3|nr:SusD/RagB family nutrient-binding outer membrane lipoprotein [uncultured Acetobacteroides sp.]